MRYFIFPLLILSLLFAGGCSAEQLSRDAEAARAQVEVLQEQLAHLERTIAVLPEGEARDRATDLLAMGRNTLQAAQTSAHALQQAADRAAMGGGWLDIGIGVLAVFVPAAGAVWHQYRQARKNFNAFRQTSKAIDHAKRELPPESIAVLHRELKVDQDQTTKDMVDKVQGK